MTTENVINELARAVIEEYRFSSHHFWNRSSNQWELQLLPFAERMLRERLHKLDDETYHQLLLECDQSGFDAQAVRQGIMPPELAEEMIMRKLRAAAGSLCKPTG